MRKGRAELGFNPKGENKCDRKSVERGETVIGGKTDRDRAGGQSHLMRLHTLVIGLVAILHAQIKELDVEIYIGQNELRRTNKKIMVSAPANRSSLW